jgi:hypothetical protein
VYLCVYQNSHFVYLSVEGMLHKIAVTI